MINRSVQNWSRSKQRLSEVGLNRGFQNDFNRSFQNVFCVFYQVSDQTPPPGSRLQIPHVTCRGAMHAMRGATECGGCRLPSLCCPCMAPHPRKSCRAGETRARTHRGWWRRWCVPPAWRWTQRYHSDAAQHTADCWQASNPTCHRRSVLPLTGVRSRSYPLGGQNGDLDKSTKVRGQGHTEASSQGLWGPARSWYCCVHLAWLLEHPCAVPAFQWNGTIHHRNKSLGTNTTFAW